MKFTQDVLLWEHCGINTSNSQNVSTDYLYIAILIPVQSVRARTVTRLTSKVLALPIVVKTSNAEAHA